MGDVNIKSLKSSVDHKVKTYRFGPPILWCCLIGATLISLAPISPIFTSIITLTDSNWKSATTWRVLFVLATIGLGLSILFWGTIKTVRIRVKWIALSWIVAVAVAIYPGGIQGVVGVTELNGEIIEVVRSKKSASYFSVNSGGHSVTKKSRVLVDETHVKLSDGSIQIARLIRSDTDRLSQLNGSTKRPSVHGKKFRIRYLQYLNRLLSAEPLSD